MKLTLLIAAKRALNTATGERDVEERSSDD